MTLGQTWLNPFANTSLSLVANLAVILTVVHVHSNPFRMVAVCTTVMASCSSMSPDLSLTSNYMPTVLSKHAWLSTWLCAISIPKIYCSISYRCTVACFFWCSPVFDVLGGYIYTYYHYYHHYFHCWYYHYYLCSVVIVLTMLCITIISLVIPLQLLTLGYWY